jgi:hypothetical protein
MPNNPRTDHDADGPDLRAPAKLLGGLRQLANQSVFIPPATDESILLAARRHLSKPARAVRRWTILIPAFGLAAVIALLTILWHGVGHHRSAEQPEFSREDINHDGQVDILDAFALAREIKTSTKPPSGMDVNGDGVVDEKDVETIATRAVKLGKDSRS